MPNPSKYRAIKTTIDDIMFDSKAESRRYCELKLLEKAGEIKDLELQPKFVLQEAFTRKDGKKFRPITYKADFRYYDLTAGHEVIEDVKGHITQQFRLRQKMFECRYPDLILKIV